MASIPPAKPPSSLGCPPAICHVAFVQRSTVSKGASPPACLTTRVSWHQLRPRASLTPGEVLVCRSLVRSSGLPWLLPFTDESFQLSEAARACARVVCRLRASGDGSLEQGRPPPALHSRGGPAQGLEPTWRHKCVREGPGRSTGTSRPWPSVK